MNPSTPLNKPPSKRQCTIPWNSPKENVPPRPNLPTPQSTPGGPLLDIPFAPSTPTPITRPGVPFAPLTPPATPLFQPSAPQKKQHPNYINGFLQGSNVKPSMKGVYTGANWGCSKLAPFTFAQFSQLTSMASLEERQWNKLMREHGILLQDQSLKDFQVEAANHIVNRNRDLCIISPTGSGKSLVWVLPLLAQGTGVSLVIVPYTSLGHQGEL
ncbi:hypothetical protein B0H34DRAFT_816282 [Crassisporium funariophilum]|nr:hypothetical protein B0H34DRAFT_816282 [Crassisporium funariophilum]